MSSHRANIGSCSPKPEVVRNVDYLGWSPTIPRERSTAAKRVPEDTRTRVGMSVFAQTTLGSCFALDFRRNPTWWCKLARFSSWEFLDRQCLLKFERNPLLNEFCYLLSCHKLEIVSRNNMRYSWRETSVSGFTNARCNRETAASLETDKFHSHCLLTFSEGNLSCPSGHGRQIERPGYASNVPKWIETIPRPRKLVVFAFT